MREFLVEDSRSKIDKLKALIDHPATEENVRDVARGRLELLLASVSPTEPLQGLSIPTNITEDDLNRDFLLGLNLGQLYDGLCSLNPPPNDIQFLRQGAIRIVVPPPFMGKTKSQYVSEILEACPGARQVQDQLIEGVGYMFLVTY